MGRGEGTTTPNKMHHLDPVSSLQRCLSPRGARSNITIVLDGNPVALEPKLSDKLVDSGRFRQRVKGTGLTVQQQSE